MPCTSRLLITLLAALWLPLCHCQLTQLFCAQASCCASEKLQSATPAAASGAKKVHGCCETNKSKSLTSARHKNSTCPDCACCVTKAPAPSVTAFTPAVVPCVMPPCIMVAASLHITQQPCMMASHQHHPPGPPLAVSERCAVHSTWLI